VTPAIVEIEWIDAASVNGWFRKSEWLDWCSGHVTVLTTGYLVSEEAGCYTVATTWTPSSQSLSGLFQIPKKMVQSMKVIKKGRT